MPDRIAAAGSMAEDTETRPASEGPEEREEGEIKDDDSSSAAPRGTLGKRRIRWTTLGFLDVLGWEEIGRKNNLNQGRELQI